MLRVVVGYTPHHLARRTVEAIVAQAPHAEFVDVSERPDSYYELFARLWADAQDFMLVEHDVVIRPGTVAALDACPEPWCSCAIAAEVERRRGEHEAYFQCNRWRREVMLERPDVTDVPMARRHWGTLDAFLLARMRGKVHPAIDSVPLPITPPVRGFEVHTHPDLTTDHCAPGLGYSGAITTIRAWRQLYAHGETPDPQALAPNVRRKLAIYQTGVDMDAIMEKLQPRKHVPGDGVAALHELELA